jgi:prepilin-type N-terminal cleavage/methylation domain-containing protein
MLKQLSHSKESGYTLVELLIAIIVGGILLGSANLIITAHTRLSHKHRDHVVLNSYAESKIEALRSAGFLSLEDGAEDYTDELPSELNEPRSSQVEVSDHVIGIKKVELTVTYNEQGTPRTQSYTTFIGELGVGQY